MDAVAVPSIESDTQRDVQLPALPAQKHSSALTPPTSEDLDKREDASSELSDLELEDDKDEADEDDIGDIEPDHYYEDGKIPVFKPTMDQFRSFKKFIEKVDKYGMKSGIIKVVPPQEWRDSLPALDQAIKTIKVKNPITQEFVGTHGTYTQQNIEKQRSYNLPQWKALTEETNHQPPAKRGERRRNVDTAKPKPVRSHNPTPLPNGEKRKPGRPRKHPLKQEAKEEEPSEAVETVETDGASKEPQVPPTPTSPEEKPEEAEKEVKQEDEVEPEETPVKAKAARGRPRKSSPKPKGRQPKATTVAERRKYNVQSAADEVDEEAFKSFDYRFPEAKDFTAERCRELEEVYWKTLNYGTPMYGADMPGSLFDEDCKSWHVGRLENLLDILGTKVPGVNTTYLYLGMWKATFAWHLEDVDLYSINYIHFGAPKQWYSISQEDARRFEAAMKTIWPTDAKHCDQFLRHKTYLISPEKLKNQFNIKVNKLVHNEGEFVITYPYGYHSGFNLGYNCAESVNFATESWLNYGRIAKKCNCEADSVWVDVSEIERKLRGEPTPEYYEETDDEDDDSSLLDVPTPPPSVPGKRGRPPGGKRKRDSKVQVGPKKTKKIRILLKVPSKMPCVLCPNEASYDKLLPTDNGQKAHRVCALYTPETYVSEATGSEIIRNVSGIDKSRLDLKCIFCRSKRGACFQCSEKKCTRAYHATCAVAAGVLVDAGPVPTWDQDGTEFYCEGFDFRCRFHRPKRPKTADVASLESSKLVKNYAKGLQRNDTVQAQYFGSDVFGGVVIENRPCEQSLLVQVLPDGDTVEVEWKWLLVLNPADSKRPKASPNAKLLPEDMHHDNEINANNRKDGVPDMDEPFLDPNSGHKWAEWHTATTAEICNPFQKKIDITQPEQLWYYLGKTSTEAKAQYTHDVAKTVHNLKSVFLDTVKPAARNTVIPDRRSFPASYPSGANFHALNGAMAAQRQQQQQPPQRPLQMQIHMDRPYQYKPKLDINSMLNPKSSPTKPQAPQYGANSQSGPAYSPPMHAAPSAAPPAFRQPTFSAPKAYQQPPSPQTIAKDPFRAGYPYQSATYTQLHGPRSPVSDTRLSQDGKSRGLSPHNGPHHRSPSGSQPQQRPPSQPGAAQHSTPVANMLADPSPSSVAPTNDQQSIPARPENFSSAPEKKPLESLSPAEYVEHIKQYPYLLNAHLRRPSRYSSPYATRSGFMSEYMPKPPASGHASPYPSASAYSLPPPVASAPAPTATMTASATPKSHSAFYSSFAQSDQTTGLPKPPPQYQTSQQFQQQVIQETPTAQHSGQLKQFERLIKQLGDYQPAPQSQAPNGHAHAQGGAGVAYGAGAMYSAAERTQTATPPMMARSSSGSGNNNGNGAAHGYKPMVHGSWRPPSPSRPEYSPLSEPGGGTPRPVLPALKSDGYVGQHGADSWRLDSRP